MRKKYKDAYLVRAARQEKLERLADKAISVLSKTLEDPKSTGVLRAAEAVLDRVGLVKGSRARLTDERVAEAIDHVLAVIRAELPNDYDRVMAAVDRALNDPTMDQ